MADAVGELKVIISAEDNASAVISGVSSSVSSLGSASGAVIGQSAAVNAAMNSNAKSAAAMGTAVNQTKNNLKQLETGLAGQKEKTLQYTRALRDSSIALREKQTAVRTAANTYKTNTSAINQNIAGLKEQQSSIAATIEKRNGEIVKLKEANKSIEKSSQAYKDNQKAIKRTETELRGLQQQHKETSTAIREQGYALRTEENAYRSAQSEVKAAARAQEEARSSMKQSQAAEKDYSDSIAKTSESLQKQQAEYEKIKKIENTISSGKGMKEFAEGVDAVAKPLFVASAAVTAAGVASAKFAVDFEDNFAAVKKTVDGTPEQMEAIKQSIIDMTTVGINGHQAIPQTTAQLTELAAAGGQLGIQTENIANFTETMAMMGTATNLAGETGAATLARFMNVTNTSQDKISNLGSAIVDLGNNFATTEAEIAQMALNMGATGNVIGISAQDVLAYSTALSSLGVEAQAGGSAVSRIWMDIQSAVSSGGDNLTKFAKISGKSSKEFADQWKNDASGAFQDFLKGLSKSEDQIGTLADLGFNNIRDIQALQRLAGDKGLELLTNAIKRSNDAWEQNVALQKEFDAKAETTASKIQVAKNNATEAARSFGEVLLPSIVDITGGLSKAAQGMAKMDDGTKKMIVNAGLTTVALGATTKAVTGGIKAVGGVVEGVGKVRGLFAAGGALANAGPALASIASAAGPVAVGIGAIGAAVLIGKASYDAWYNSQYRWSQGLSEGNAKIKESRDKLQELSSLRKEINDNQWIINNGESSLEDVEKAKARIEEIKELLEEEYNLVIKTDNSNLDEAVEKAQELTGAELKLREAQQLNKLNQLAPKEENYAENYAKLEQEYNNASDAALKYMNTQTELKGIQKDVDSGLISHADALKKAKQVYYDKTGETFTETAGKTDLENFIALMTNIQSKYEMASQRAGDYKEKMDELKASHEEFQAIATELSNWKVEDITKFAQEGNNEGVINSLKEMGEYIRTAGLDMNGYAQAASLAMNGLTDFNGAVEKFANGDGADLSAIIRDYSTAMDAFGATAEQKQAGLQSFAQQLTDIAHNAGLFEGKQIEITADGKIEWKDIEPPEEEVTAPGKVEWSDTEPPKEETTADGTVEWGDTKPPEPAPIETLGTINWTKTEPPQEAHEEVKTDGTVEWQDTEPPEPAPIEVLGQINWAKSEPPEQEEFTAEGTVNYSGNYDNAGEAPQKEGVASYTGDYSGVGEAPEKSGTARYTGDFSGIGKAPTLHGTIVYTAQYTKQATGTQNFEGGLAMVNDQRGVSDPREMIVDKGRAFIPDGRDVILPLSKGAKVFTAAQTKRIMAGAGIPHYASGKNNHYGYDITDEQLRNEYEHLQGMLVAKLRAQGYSKSNAEESAQAVYGPLIGELGGSSKSNSTSGSTGSGGKKENSEAFKTAKEEWTHYTKTHAVTTEEELKKYLEFQEKYKDNQKDIEDIEEEVFAKRQKLMNEDMQRRRDMLIHNEKYNDASKEEYLAGIDEMRAKNEQYYNEGLKSYDEYIKDKIKLDEEYFDKHAELYDQMFDISMAYADDRTYFNDWQGINDDPIAAFNRVKDRELGAIGDGRTRKDAEKNIAEYGSALFQGRIKQSKAWLEEQRRYFNISDADYAAGIQRMKDYTQEYFKQGIISARETHEAMTELRHMELDEAASAYDTMLQNQQTYINEMRDKFQKQEQSIRDSWTVEDRKTSIAELSENVRLWSGAVTERGKEQLKQYEEQLKQARREEELYNIQQSNNAIIDKLEKDYEKLEENKKKVLAQIASTEVNISGIVDSFTSTVEGQGESVVNLLQTLINTVENKEIKGGDTYKDDRKVTTTTTINNNYGVGSIALPYLVGR